MIRLRLLRSAVLLAVMLAVGFSQSAEPALAQSSAPEGSILEDRYVQEEAKRGLDFLYDMEFDRAQVIFNRIDRRYPDHPVGPFLNSLTLWWQMMLDWNDEQYDDAFLDMMSEVIDRADAMLDQNSESFDGAFFKSAAVGYRGRLRSNRGRWFRAAMDGRRAMRYVHRVADTAPNNPDYMFGKGMYDYYAAMIPERYPFARPFMTFFPDGDRERGLETLHRTAEEGWYIQTEARYFLLQINYLFERDFTGSRRHVSWLREHHPNNPFFHNYEGRIYARWGRWRTAQRIFSDILERHQEGRPGYNEAMAEPALYYLARVAMVYGNYSEAMGYLNQLEQVTRRTDEDTYYKVLGRLRQGMAMDALGRRDIAQERYRTVLGMEDQAGAHSRAREYLNEPYRN